MEADRFRFEFQTGQPIPVDALWRAEVEDREARDQLWGLYDQVLESRRAVTRWLFLALDDIERQVDPEKWENAAEDDEDWVSLRQGWGADTDVAELACAVVERRLTGTGISPGADAVVQVTRSAGWWWAFDHLTILTERPTVLRYDTEDRLHSATGPAVAYPDGLSVWAWHGVVVPCEVIQQPERLTVRQIRQEPNLEVRRVMLERYGTERYLREVGAERVGQDEVGTLWRAGFGEGEPLMMVEVRNSTPEPDGSCKTYWLRVPPRMQTAREAVAWTFGLTAAEYRPVVET